MFFIMKTKYNIELLERIFADVLAYHKFLYTNNTSKVSERLHNKIKKSEKLFFTLFFSFFSDVL